ncbi:MAG: hypothetical protein WC385_01540 [Candidatus Paceibacterota bacterium]|jgi:hypothetical protein
MRYLIEHWIETLATNAVKTGDGRLDSFSRDEIVFSHSEFNFRDGWIGHNWIASGTIDADDHITAINSFRGKLIKIIPKIALISQCYIDFISQSFLVIKEDRELAFFRYVNNIEPTPLMFMENELKALDILLENGDIPEEFYYRWNDLVNSYGYTSKLLNIISAIESLTKKPNGEKDWEKRKLILGEDLVTHLWGPSGLRHRLSHGDYYIKDDDKNYLDLIHQKIISYFNDYVLKEKLLATDIIKPQRHFFGNKEEGRWFIKPKQGNQINIKDVLKDFNENGIHDIKNYEYEWDKEITGAF